MANKNTQKQGFMQRTGNFVVLASGWPLLMLLAKWIGSLWVRITGRDHEPVHNDTFEKACRRHGVTLCELVKFKKNLLGVKRSYWVLMWVSVVFWVFGLFLIMTAELTMARANMTIVSFWLMWLFAMMCLKYTFRHWQCEVRRLGTLDEFWASGGIKMILKW